MSPPTVVRALAPAKVNLWLEVLHRRADGFHEIRTWMLAIDLCDRVEAAATRSGGVELRVEPLAGSPDVPTGRANLAWRGAEAALLRGRRLGRLRPDQGIAVTLGKRIPSQAGLGGGSSDAAAAFLAAERALDLDLGSEHAAEALGALGSDCAFFVAASRTGMAVCEGRGERVTPLSPPPDGWVVAVASPAIACQTAQVYAALARTERPSDPRPEPHAGWLAEPLEAVRGRLFNRLEAAALAAFPQLRDWRALLDSQGGDHWRLSGSGSSFFGLYGEAREADAALERIRRAALAAGLPVRATWRTRPSGHGARNLEQV